MNGNQQLILKLTLAFLAAVTTIFFLYVAGQLALNGQNGPALLAGIGGPIVGNGGLFWLFKELSK